MGSFVRTARGIGAAVLVTAGLSAAASPAQARATVSVSCSTADLISKIQAANTAGSGTLRLASFCTYDLTAAFAQATTRGPDGLPIITGHLTLLGGPSTVISRFSGAPQFRIFEVASSGSLFIRGIFIRGGDAGLNPGGGILNARGSLELEFVTVHDNKADSGAGVANDKGNVEIEDTVVEDNTTASTGASGGGGGGVYNDGTMLLSLSRVSSNTSNTDGGGIINEQNGRMTLFHVSVLTNTARVFGGGLVNRTGATVRLSRTLVRGNEATSGGGIFTDHPAGVVLSNSSVIQNVPNNCVPLNTIASCVN